MHSNLKNILMIAGVSTFAIILGIAIDYLDLLKEIAKLSYRSIIFK